MSDVAAVPEEPIRAAFLELRYKAIRAHIAKGDKAKDKAEQHYITAGQPLRALKAEHAGTWDEWEALLKDKIGIGKSRASELMQIADGRKTVEGIRADTAERTAKTRALQSSPLRSGGGHPSSQRRRHAVRGGGRGKLPRNAIRPRVSSRGSNG